MFRAHLRLLAAFLVLGVVAAAVVGMFYAWSNYLEPSFQARQEIFDLEKVPPKRIDVGAIEFLEAMDQMRQGKVAAAHLQLSSLVKTYADSSAFSKSRRILGEVNMDQLLSNVRTPGKTDYVVKGGDSYLYWNKFRCVCSNRKKTRQKKMVGLDFISPSHVCNICGAT